MKTKVALVSAAISLLIFAAPVFGQSYSPNPSARPLSSASLRSCQAREAAVKVRMTNLKDLASTVEKAFDAIAFRVEDFYTLRVLTSGKTVKNYDALVADIATKKGIVDTDLASAGDMVNMFTCTTDDPRGLLLSFRINMQKVKTDLKDYRTSIKNLIVAVRPLAPTPMPSATP